MKNSNHNIVNFKIDRVYLTKNVLCLIQVTLSLWHTLYAYYATKIKYDLSQPPRSKYIDGSTRTARNNITTFIYKRWQRVRDGLQTFQRGLEKDGKGRTSARQRTRAWRPTVVINDAPSSLETATTDLTMYSLYGLWRTILPLLLLPASMPRVIVKGKFALRRHNLSPTGRMRHEYYKYQ